MGSDREAGSHGNRTTNQPSSPYLVGTLDEVAVYTTQLADVKIARHYASNF